MLVVGAKGSGKSTLIARFLNPDNQDAPKETMGLDYVFARRTSTGAQEKQVAHIWELGGGEDQANLMDAVITPENLRNFVCLVCVDLSQPSAVLDTLAFWVERLRTRIDNCLRVMSEKKSTVPDRLRERALVAFGPEHQDRELVNLCPVPIVVVATKFEAFQNEEAEYRKIMGRTLRFLAHVNGASLYYTSCREKALLSQSRSVLSNFFFGGQRSGAAARHVVDHSKALAVRAGSDQISGIGAPPRVDTQARPPAPARPRARSEPRASAGRGPRHPARPVQARLRQLLPAAAEEDRVGEPRAARRSRAARLRPEPRPRARAAAGGGGPRQVRGAGRRRHAAGEGAAAQALPAGGGGEQALTRGACAVHSCIRACGASF